MNNASDRKSIREAEKAAKLAETQRQDVIRQIMATVPGREWMCNRLTSMGIFQTTFTGDPLTSAYNEGRRSAGLQDLGDVMSACPDQYILMMREANERSTTAAAKQSRGEDAGRDVEGRGPTDDDRDDDGNPAFDGYDRGYVSENGQDRY